MSNTWKPIKTAPRNGRSILAYGSDEGSKEIYICFYGETGSKHIPDDALEEGFFSWMGYDWIIRKPTHWMPLPKRPTI